MRDWESSRVKLKNWQTQQKMNKTFQKKCFEAFEVTSKWNIISPMNILTTDSFRISIINGERNDFLEDPIFFVPHQLIHRVALTTAANYH